MIQSFILSIVLANPQALLETAESNISSSKWSEAAKDLDEYVRIAEHPTAEAMYDRGIAHYNLGDYEIAGNSFDEAMSISNDPMLQTYSAFNLGNAIYRQTLESLEGTGTGAPSGEAMLALEDAKSQIKQVLKSYRSAIASDHTDMDARANGELAWQMLQQLNQMQEQMEEKQQEQDDDEEQDEQSANQQQENQEQKDDGTSEEEQQKQDKKQSEEGEESNEQKQQGGEQQQDGEQSDQEQQQNQQQDGEQSDQEQQQNQQQDGEQSNKEQQQNQQQDGEQSNKEQQQNQQQDGEQSNKEQQQNQQQDGELESTDEEMNEIKAPSTSIKDEGERLSEDEANRLLQLIRDKEQQRRKAIAARRAANRVPVGKDW